MSSAICMKSFPFLSTLTIVLLFGVSPKALAQPTAPPIAAPERYGLLIGINDYAQPPDRTYTVSPLKGPKNDVALMKDLLTSRYHFKDDPEHIVTLLDSQATHAAIKLAFQKQLIDKAAQHPGAIVVFYFSGHGSQENLKDENSNDTRDHDTLVAYDSRESAGADILDNEMISWFEELRKHTTNITFVLDSCHSGSEIKNVDTLVSREIPPNPRVNVMRSPPAGGTHYTAESDFGLSRRQQFALLSASLDYESSYEDKIGTKYDGFFTYYLYQALQQHPDTTNEYAVRYTAQALVLKSPNQHPQAVGNVEGQVFGGTGQGDDPYVEVLSIGADDTFEIHEGAIQGLHEGTFLAVYSPSARRLVGETNKLANAHVIKVGGFTSTAKLSDKPKQPLSLQDRVSIVTPFFGFNDFLTVRLYDFPNQAAATPAEQHILNGVRAELGTNKLVKFAEAKQAWDIGVQKGGCVLNGRIFAATDKRSHDARCAYEYYLTDSKGDVPLLGFHVSLTTPDAVSEIVKRIELRAKQNNIRAVVNAQSPLQDKVVVKLLPVSIVKDAAGQPQVVPQGDPVNDGYQRLNVGRSFELKIENNSDKNLYCAVIMLGTSGNVELLTANPHGDLIPTHNSLLTFPPRDAGRPLGIETYKVIATTASDVDFRYIEQSGAAKGVGDSPLGWLLGQTTNVKVRDSTVTADVNLNEWTASALDILVQEP